MSCAPHSHGLPAQSGMGLRFPHHAEMLASRPQVGWLEVHSENFFVEGGPTLHVLECLRQDYPVSLHGVGLSLGATDPLSKAHLQQLQQLIHRIEPAAVSEHLCWSSVEGHYLNDLLPLPYTREALDHVCARIDTAQDLLRRPLLIENVSSYLRFDHEEMPEWEFLAQVAQRTGCGLLLDINNVHVSAHNHGFDALQFIEAMPVHAVQELHLAGYEVEGDLYIDTHSCPVHAPVWALFHQALERLGPKPTLIEWDQNLPALDELLNEAHRAQHMLNECKNRLNQESRHACPA
jgi:uncharacterized protein